MKYLVMMKLSQNKFLHNRRADLWIREFKKSNRVHTYYPQKNQVTIEENGEAVMSYRFINEGILDAYLKVLENETRIDELCEDFN